MTMFPHHLQSLGNNKNSFGGGGECRRYYDCPSFINDDLMEADHQDESRTTSKIFSSSNVKETSESSTSSKDVEIINKDQDQDHQEGWLQLSLGTSSHVISRPDDHQISLVPRLPVELDLLPPGSASSTSSSSQPQMTWSQPHQLSFQFPDFPMSIPTTPSFFLQRGGSAPAIDSVTFNHHLQYQNNNYMIRPMLTLSSPPSFSAGRPLHFNSGGALDVGAPPPLRMDLRVMNPPPRPHHSGVWFNLQASLNQTKQPYLPQVPKRYLRIKDGRATVRLLIKYLANKLNLDSEFEIGITCKGEQLLPLLTLQHVRDNIWSNPTKDVVFSQSSATIDHLMVLNYGRI